jgi:antitoxin MazE
VHSEATISKWGNSLAVRIPQSIAKQAGLNEGDSVSMDLDNQGGIVLRRARPIYGLAELVSQITPKNRHQETDLGKPQGVESW